MKSITKNTITITTRTKSFNRFFADLKSVQTELPHRKQVELINHYKNTGCIASRNKVVEANLLFCAKCAKSYVQNNVPTMSFGDLISVCTEAMIKAIDKFDASMGYKVISYAVNWIKQYLGIYIQSKSRTIKQHSHSATVYKVIKQIKNEGKEVTAENVFNKISKGNKRKFTLETVSDILLTMNVKSLEIHVIGDWKTIGDSIECEDYSPDAAYQNTDSHRKLTACVHHLKQKEREVISMYFGLNGCTASSFTDIAYRQGLTVEAVRQRYKIAIKRLRYFMKKGGMQKKLF